MTPAQRLTTEPPETLGSVDVQTAEIHIYTCPITRPADGARRPGAGDRGGGLPHGRARLHDHGRPRALHRQAHRRVQVPRILPH